MFPSQVFPAQAFPHEGFHRRCPRCSPACHPPREHASGSDSRWIPARSAPPGRVQESDREGYLEIKRAYLVTKHMLKEPTYCNMLWEEYIASKRLTLSIHSDGSYIGYCGINNLLQEPWEIGIELRPEWTRRGIGYRAVSAMLKEIQTRLGVHVFCVRIEPRNLASQRLFEKLGAVPDGLTVGWTANQEIVLQCEEDNLDQIDEELIRLAEKFGVPPRKLLSHVLRYSLELKQK